MRCAFAAAVIGGDAAGNPLECGPAIVRIVEGPRSDESVSGFERRARTGAATLRMRQLLRVGHVHACFERVARVACATAAIRRQPRRDLVQDGDRLIGKRCAGAHARIARVRRRRSGRVGLGTGRHVQTFDQILQPRGRAQPVRRRTAGIAILRWVGEHGWSEGVPANRNGCYVVGRSSGPVKRRRRDEPHRLPRCRVDPRWSERPRPVPRNRDARRASSHGPRNRQACGRDRAMLTARGTSAT